MSEGSRTHLSFGIDIGGSGMKAAPVDLDAGMLATDRLKIATPKPATPDTMVPVVAELVERFEWKAPIGVTFPGVVRDGVTLTAANVHDSWIGVEAAAMFGKVTGLAVHVVNDADAAGVAEMRYGAGRGRDGVVLVLTFGTGIGSALFVDGTLVPNTELGHLELGGEVAEHRASARARDQDGLSWKKWAETRVNDYLGHVVRLFSPSLIIIGGGVSRKPEKWFHHIDAGVEIVPAALTNDAGIVGAALLATA